MPTSNPATRPALHREDATARFLRQAVLALFLFGAAGSLLELVLLEHVEDPWQWAPLVLLGLSLLALAVLAIFRRGRAGALCLRAFQGVMVLFLASGVVGLWLHYEGNMEFELEMYPSRQGWELFRETLGGATPALAPGMMILLGLLGLAYAYRHPAVHAAVPSDDFNRSSMENPDA